MSDNIVYMAFKEIPRDRPILAGSMDDIYRQHKQRFSQCYLIYQDGFMINYTEYGLILGNNDVHPGIWWYPQVFESTEHDHRYQYILTRVATQSNEDRKRMMNKISKHYGLAGELKKDVISVLTREYGKDIIDYKRYTNAGFLAWCIGLRDAYTYTPDKIFALIPAKPYYGTYIHSTRTQRS